MSKSSLRLTVGLRMKFSHYPGVGHQGFVICEFQEPMAQATPKKVFPFRVFRVFRG